MLSVCPSSQINAPIEKVWEFLRNPSLYSTWTGASIKLVEPTGKAHAGQIVRLQSRVFGIKWNVTMKILNVNEKKHHISMETHLPFGILQKNEIQCETVNEKACIVRYGSDAFFPTGRKGQAIGLLIMKTFEHSIEYSLNQLKTVSEKESCDS